MKTSVTARVVGWGVGLLLLGALATRASAQQLPISACGVYGGSTSYIVTADLTSTGATCLTFTSNGTTLNLNGHSIRGTGINAGISFTVGTSSFNNNTITGPGIVHDFATCLDLRGNHNLVQDILAYNCESFGIRLGDFSKCVQCRVHDVRASEGFGIGISQGLGCLLESSIVESSDVGAVVGTDCKVWGLVVDSVITTGLAVGAGTSVARTVISHYHDGPGLDYTSCTLGAVGTAAGCQDSSNSVSVPLSASAPAIADTGATVVTDGATNVNGIRYRGSPTPEFAYVTNQGANTVSAYTINSTTGALSPVSGSPFAAGAQPFGVAVDRSGKFAYVTNANANTISAYTINSTTGALYALLRDGTVFTPRRSPQPGAAATLPI